VVLVQLVKVTMVAAPQLTTTFLILMEVVAVQANLVTDHRSPQADQAMAVMV
jgi:hypothetical protein